MSLPARALAILIAALALAAGGFGAGIRWQQGAQARADLQARELRESDARQQRQIADHKVVAHLTTVATLNRQLGAAHETIRRLPGRDCLDPDAVRVLNAIGSADDVRATPGRPDEAPGPAATGTGLRFATDRDAAAAIATCRGAYAEVADQLNQILDIEEARHRPRP